MIFFLTLRSQTSRLLIMASSRWRPALGDGRPSRRRLRPAAARPARGWQWPPLPGPCPGASSVLCSPCPDSLITQKLRGNMLSSSRAMCFSHGEQGGDAARVPLSHAGLVGAERRDWPVFDTAFSSSQYLFLIPAVSLTLSIRVSFLVSRAACTVGSCLHTHGSTVSVRPRRALFDRSGSYSGHLDKPSGGWVGTLLFLQCVRFWHCYNCFPPRSGSQTDGALESFLISRKPRCTHILVFQIKPFNQSFIVSSNRTRGMEEQVR